MKKSINLWAFPYPDRMTLKECLELAKRAGFDGVELNYDLENDLSPKAGPAELKAIRRMADDIGIAISGLCSFLFWPYPLTSNDPVKREAASNWRAGSLKQLMNSESKTFWWFRARYTFPGATIMSRCPMTSATAARAKPWQTGQPGRKLKVSLNIENIFFNGYLMSPMEMNAFVDSFNSEHVRCILTPANFDVPVSRTLVPALGKRTRNIHFKEFTRKGTDYSLETFRPLLDGTTIGLP